jgi:hypothetical protein
MTTPSTQATQAMLINLAFNFGRQGGKDKELTDELCQKYGSSERAVTGSKIVICKEAMEPLKKASGCMRTRLMHITTAWDIPGVYLCKPTNIAKAFALRDECFPLLETLKNEHLLGRYDEWQEITKTQLAGRYKESEFPTAADLNSGVSWTMSISALPESEALRRIKDIDDSFMEKLVEANDQRVDAAVKSGMKSAYQRLMEPLQNMVDVLSKDKPRIFETLVTNVRDVINEIPGLNLIDESELQRFADKSNELLNSITADTLRDSPVVRQETVDKAKEIMESFGAAGVRKFSL